MNIDSQTNVHLLPEKLSGKKILVLGGEGFVGRNIVSYFSGENTCVSIGEEKSFFSEERKDVFLKMNPYAEKIPGTYDIILHLIDHKVSESDFFASEKNIFSNINISEKTEVVVFSSAVVYANRESDYGKRKLLLEEIFSTECKKRGVSLIILRPFNLFGPFQIPYRQGSLVANLFYNFLIGEGTDINDMEAKRDFLYSKDIARFVEYALLRGMRGTFDVGSGKLLSIRECISLLESDILGKTLNITDKKNKESIIQRSAVGKLVESVSIRNIRDGLMETFDFYRKNKNSLRNFFQAKNR